MLCAHTLNICVVVTSVHLPCVMTSTHEEGEADLAVNAAAIEASPSFTEGVVCIAEAKASARSCIFRSCRSFGPPPPPPGLLPPFRWRSEDEAPNAVLLSSSGLGGGGGATRDAVTSATDTSLCLSAPTSFVPSPHMRLTNPHSRKVDNATSFCVGLIRARTRRCGNAA